MRIAPVLVACLLGGLAFTGAGAQATGTSSHVFAQLPASPGHPDTSLIGRDGYVYVSTNRGATGGLGGPASVLYQFYPNGRLRHTFTITGQDLAHDHGAMGLAEDAAGRIYIADYAPARILRLDPRTGRQETYAPIPNLPACAPVLPGRPLGAGCDNSGGKDSAPWPDGLAFDGAGNLYVTDLAQGTIFRIRPRTHHAEIFSQDPQFVSPFGPNGISTDAHGNLVISTTTTIFGPSAPDGLGRGGLYHLAIRSDGNAGPAVRFYNTLPAAGPDSFAIARSGQIYLVTLVTNELQVISPSGELVKTSGPTPPGTGLGFDSPSSVSFTGVNVLVTNLAYFTSRSADYQVLEVGVGETGLPLDRPAVP